MEKSDLPPAVAKFLKARTQEELDAFNAEYDPSAKKSEQAISSKNKSASGPDRFIGPRTPDHPEVNKNPGGRDPA
jgi:hypothetical protein